MEYLLRWPSHGTESEKKKLVVFVNGLRSSMKDWEGITAELVYRHPHVYTLAYDRWGVGGSDPIPPSRHGRNDLSTAAEDLGLVLKSISKRYTKLSPGKTRLVLVGSSIGCSIIRYFLGRYSGGIPNVDAVVMLDSYLANSDFISLFPAKRDDEPEALTRTRDIVMKIFGLEVKNNEGFDRTTAASFLPSAGLPPLPHNPYLVVVIHDSEYMVNEMVESMGIDKKWYLLCVDNAVVKYHQDMLEGLSARGKWVVAEKAGHFIHADRVDLVIDEIIGALENCTV